MFIAKQLEDLGLTKELALKLQGNVNQAGHEFLVACLVALNDKEDTKIRRRYLYEFPNVVNENKAIMDKFIEQNFDSQIFLVSLKKEVVIRLK